MDPRREDVDEPYMDSLFEIVRCRSTLNNVDDVTPERLAAITELIDAYHEQVVRSKRQRRGVLNRFWMAWQAVLAVW